MATQEELYRKALAFTGNKKLAEETAEAAAGSENPLLFTTEESVRRMREMNPELFTKDVVYRPGEEEFTASDPETDIAGLEPEERIAVLLAAYDGMTDEQAAAMLGVSPEYVKGLRQNAWKRKNPAKKNLPVPAEKRRTAEVVGKKKGGKKLPVGVQIGISLVIAALLGAFFGIRRYAASQYEKGLDLLENNEFEQAVNAFLTADRYGFSGGEIEKYLGEAYYYSGSPEEAVTWLEKYYGSQTDLNEMQLECYETVWKQSLENGDYAKAADMMRREYQYSRSPYSLFRQKAAESGDTFTDEKGNVYNVYGQPETIVVYDPAGTEIYRAALSYDENHDLISVGSLKDIVRKNGAEYLLEIHPHYTVSTITEPDSHGSPAKKTSVSQDKKEEIKYDNTYERGLLKQSVYKIGDTEYTDVYEYKDGKLAYIRHKDSVTTFGYDAEGRLEKEVTRQGLQDTEIIRYEYDDKGLMVRRSVFSTGKTETFDYAPDGVPFTSEITGSDGVPEAAGYYIRNTGWVYFCYE